MKKVKKLRDRSKFREKQKKMWDFSLNQREILKDVGKNQEEIEKIRDFFLIGEFF